MEPPLSRLYVLQLQRRDVGELLRKRDGLYSDDKIRDHSSEWRGRMESFVRRLDAEIEVEQKRAS